jgi:hypothetical protein
VPDKHDDTTGTAAWNRRDSLLSSEKRLTFPFFAVTCLVFIFTVLSDSDVPSHLIPVPPVSFAGKESGCGTTGGNTSISLFASPFLDFFKYLSRILLQSGELWHILIEKEDLYHGTQKNSD